MTGTVPMIERTPSLIELYPGVAPPAALPDRIYAVVKHRILTCTMLPGDRIVEKDLCREMQVSRTPLREAFNRLALEGLIVLSPYRGYTVAPVTIQGYQELCELRRIVEGGTAARAAQVATPDDVRQMTDAAEAGYTPSDRESYRAHLRKNSAFHLSLVRATHNRHLEALLMSALDRHQRPLYLGLDLGDDGDLETRDHLEITAAVRDHEPERARARMSDHIAREEERIVAALRAAGF